MAHPYRRTRLTLLFIFLTALFTPAASALITGGTGNDPVGDAGWPLGSVDVANLETRVGWWEGPPFGGGQYQFLYRGTSDDFNAALQTFARVRAPAIELVVLDGPQEAFWLKIDRGDKDKKFDARVDWTFDVWVPANWHRLYNNPKSVYASDQPNFRRPVDPPRMHVYVGGGSVEWDKVKVPDGMKVIDRRAAAKGVEAVGGAVLRGGVYDMASGKPVSRARVVLEKNTGANQWETVASAEADGLGAFEVAKIPAGTFRVVVSADGYAPRAIGSESFADKTFREISVELITEAKLIGTVADDSGKPVPGAKIRPTPLAIDGRGYASPRPAEVITDQQGRFELQGLPQGFAELWCSATGYFQPEAVGKLYDVPSEKVTIKLVGTGRLKVTVVGPDGKPVASGVHVHVNPPGERIGKWGGSAELKPDGTYEFDGVPPGQYWASTDFDPSGPAEQNPAAKPVTVEPGKLAEVKLVHRAGGRATKRRISFQEINHVQRLDLLRDVAVAAPVIVSAKRAGVLVGVAGFHDFVRCRDA